MKKNLITIPHVALRYRVLIVVALSFFVASLISYAHIKIFPNILNPTVLLEPVLFSTGFLPYNNFGDQKTVLLQYLIAVLLPFFGGDAVLTITTLHALLVLAILSISLLWVYKVKGFWAFLATAVFFLAWSLPFGYWAMMYFDFVLTPIFGFALFFLTLPKDRQTKILSFLFGVVTGIAILIKQQGVALCLLFAIWIMQVFFAKKTSLARLGRFCGVYLIGMLLPISTFCLLFYLSGGDLGELYYWTVEVNLTGNYGNMAVLWPDKNTLFTYLPSLIGFILYILMLFKKSNESKPSRRKRLWLLLVALSTLIFIFPRWSSRHLAPLFAFLGLISGIALADLVRLPPRTWKEYGKLFLYLGIICWWGGISLKTYQTHLMLEQTYRYGEYSNLIELADEINRTIPSEESVIILPTDEALLNLYYISERRPPPYLFLTLPWFAEPRVIHRWLKMNSDSPPSAAIYLPGRWELETYAPEIVNFITSNYRIEKETYWQGNKVLIMKLVP